MTEKELRKIFDDAEAQVCNQETYNKIVSEIKNSDKTPPSNEVEFSIRVNRVLDREILLAVLKKVLVDK